VFSEKHFPRPGITQFLEKIKSCNWDKRRGKYVDFYSMQINTRSQVAFIYEYYLLCDSLRFILLYDLTHKKPEFINIGVENLKNKNNMIVNPQKQLINDPAIK
jgi:hypothetical protein